MKLGQRSWYSYGLDGPEIDSRWGARFSAPVQTGSETHPNLPYNCYWVSFCRVKRPGYGVDHRLPSSAKVKERVELYIYSSFALNSLFWGELYLYFTGCNLEVIADKMYTYIINSPKIKCNNIFNNKDVISYRRNARLAADVTSATERVMVPPAFYCSERG